MLNEVILRILMAVYRARRLVLIKEWGVCFGGGSQGAFEVGHGRLDVCVVGHDHNWSIEETCQRKIKKDRVAEYYCIRFTLRTYFILKTYLNTRKYTLYAACAYRFSPSKTGSSRERWLYDRTATPPGSTLK